jgi:hypothetical protein
MRTRSVEMTLPVASQAERVMAWSAMLTLGLRASAYRTNVVGPVCWPARAARL